MSVELSVGVREKYGEIGNMWKKRVRKGNIYLLYYHVKSNLTFGKTEKW